MNVIALTVFELIYFEAGVNNLNYYAMDTIRPSQTEEETTPDVYWLLRYT